MKFISVTKAFWLNENYIWHRGFHFREKVSGKPFVSTPNWELIIFKTRIINKKVFNENVQIFGLSVDDNFPFEYEVANHSQEHKRETKCKNVIRKLICFHGDFLQEFVGVSVDNDFELKSKLRPQW